MDVALYLQALVVTQLETRCCCRLVDTAQEVAELVKTYTKAVMEKPNKCVDCTHLLVYVCVHVWFVYVVCMPSCLQRSTGIGGWGGGGGLRSQEVGEGENYT